MEAHDEHFRKGLRINTNMAIELMHKMIKVNYFKGITVKRLDKAMKLIFEYLDDKQHDQLVEQFKGKSTKRSTVIWKNHKVACERLGNYDYEQNEAMYIMKSTSGRKYTIGLRVDQCPYEGCGLQCQDCNICLHTINCSCFDNSILFEMCIHCHAFAMLHQRKQTNLDKPGCQDIDYEIESNVEYEPFEVQHQNQNDFFENDLNEINFSETAEEKGDEEEKDEDEEEEDLHVLLALKLKLKDEISQFLAETDKLCKIGDCVKAIKIARHAKNLIKIQTRHIPLVKFGGQDRKTTLKRTLVKQRRKFISTKKKSKRKNALKNPTKDEKQKILEKYYNNLN